MTLTWSVAPSVWGQSSPSSSESKSAASARDPILADGGRVEQNLYPEKPRPAIVVGLPTAVEDGTGKLQILPNTAATEIQGGMIDNPDWTSRQETLFSGNGQFPELLTPGALDSVTSQSVLDDSLGELPFDPAAGVAAHSPLFPGLAAGRGHLRQRARGWFERVFGCDCTPGGIGRERLPNALFLIDSAVPSNNQRVRFIADYTRTTPDRAEYYWAKTGSRGPAFPETSVDAQEMRIFLESGGANFSVTTELPFRSTNPEINPNHAGFGDMSVLTKTVLKNGNQIQFTQTFKSYFNTGAPSSGLGVGHVSFEPGAILRYKFRPQTEFFSQLSYWFPVGSDPTHSGQVLNWGFGAAHTWIDEDDFAVLPTLELNGWSVLNGQETLPDGSIISSDGTQIINLTPGCRFVFDTGGDLGLLEIGIGTSIPVTHDRWYEGSMFFELRSSF